MAFFRSICGDGSSPPNSQWFAERLETFIEQMLNTPRHRLPGGLRWGAYSMLDWVEFAGRRWIGFVAYSISFLFLLKYTNSV